MTDYRRLTEKNINDVEFCNGCSYNDDFNGCEDGGCDKYFLYFNVYERLRKLEDMIENGRLVDANDVESENAALRERLDKAVELKAKVGDKIYMPWVWAGGSGIAVLEVLYIQMFADELEYNTDFEADDLAYAAFYKFGKFRANDFGEIVFTTREAAKARLAELKGEKGCAKT